MTYLLVDSELFWQVTAILRPLLPAAVLRVYLP
jgi:hypothetical protein